MVEMLFVFIIMFIGFFFVFSVGVIYNVIWIVLLEWVWELVMFRVVGFIWFEILYILMG